MPSSSPSPASVEKPSSASVSLPSIHEMFPEHLMPTDKAPSSSPRLSGRTSSPSASSSTSASSSSPRHSPSSSSSRSTPPTPLTPPLPSGPSYKASYQASSSSYPSSSTSTLAPSTPRAPTTPAPVSFDVLRSSPSSTSLTHLVSSTTLPTRGVGATFAAPPSVVGGGAHSGGVEYVPVFRGGEGTSPYTHHPHSHSQQYTQAHNPYTHPHQYQHHSNTNRYPAHDDESEGEDEGMDVDTLSPSSSNAALHSSTEGVIEGLGPHSQASSEHTGGLEGSFDGSGGGAIGSFDGNTTGGEGQNGSGKKHVCPTCLKRFNRPSSLRIHVNTHTGATPFRCPWPNCGREFNVNSNMRRHYRNHTAPGFARGGGGASSSQHPSSSSSNPHVAATGVGPNPPNPNLNPAQHQSGGTQGGGAQGPPPAAVHPAYYAIQVHGAPLPLHPSTSSPRVHARSLTRAPTHRASTSPRRRRQSSFSSPFAPRHVRGYVYGREREGREGEEREGGRTVQSDESECESEYERVGRVERRRAYSTSERVREGEREGRERGYERTKEEGREGRSPRVHPYALPGSPHPSAYAYHHHPRQQPHGEGQHPVYAREYAQRYGRERDGARDRGYDRPPSRSSSGSPTPSPSPPLPSPPSRYTFYPAEGKTRYHAEAGFYGDEYRERVDGGYRGRVEREYAGEGRVYRRESYRESYRDDGEEARPGGYGGVRDDRGDVRREGGREKEEREMYHPAVIPLESERGRVSTVLRPVSDERGRV